jgi:hypothetical protein
MFALVEFVAAVECCVPTVLFFSSGGLFCVVVISLGLIV